MAKGLTGGGQEAVPCPRAGRSKRDLSRNPYCSGEPSARTFVGSIRGVEARYAPISGGFRPRLITRDALAFVLRDPVKPTREFVDFAIVGRDPPRSSKLGETSRPPKATSFPPQGRRGVRL